MKMITIKLSEEQAKELGLLSKERFGWMALAERSLKKLWENKKDKETWKKY